LSLFYKIFRFYRKLYKKSYQKACSKWRIYLKFWA